MANVNVNGTWDNSLFIRKLRNSFRSLKVWPTWTWQFPQLQTLKKLRIFRTLISWNWATLAKNIFYIKMTGKNVCIFSFLFSYAKNTTHIEKNQSEASQPSIQDSSNGKVVESWPDLEMNSAQVAFLDFIRPRCWTLALSWNELSSGSFFRLRTATLLNPVR